MVGLNQSISKAAFIMYAAGGLGGGGQMIFFLINFFSHPPIKLQ